ncbi:MAG: hypothetical protein M1814_000997 [Vezdaea aestivalis]|nr:MAG: hypothetical protein M1814_000997 [Vezdaea aestivalis]
MLSGFRKRLVRTGSVDNLLKPFEKSTADVVLDRSDPDSPEWDTAIGSIPVRWIHTTKDGIRNFKILQNYLEPNSTTSLQKAGEAILRVVPTNKMNSTEIWTFGQDCIDLVEQIPYSNPCQLRLAGLLKYLGSSSSFSQMDQREDSRIWHDSHQKLRESLVDRRNISPYGEDKSEIKHVNFTAFCAKLGDNQVYINGTEWAVADMEAAHENPLEEGVSKEVAVLAAAQWILW